MRQNLENFFSHFTFREKEMDVQTREQLQERLHEYISGTFEDIKTVINFCDIEEEWILWRKTEIKMMRDIKRHAEKFLGHLKKQKLEEELGEVLNNTLEGLKILQPFLDAVERLAVTSLHVFKEESVQLEGVSSSAVQSVIFTARFVSPILIHFKRDSRAFFMPNLDNVEVLIFQLEKYILLTQQICERISKNTLRIRGIQKNHSWKFSFTMSGSMIRMIDDLSKIRMDKPFRLSFLFKENAEHFIETFSECRPRMFQFLSDLEETAVKLDRMKMGSSISTVAGSSVGVVGGVVSIVGLALAPVTAGASLALTLTGLGLGVTSGVNSMVTGITESLVNKHHRGNANSIFQKFMKDVQKILDCLDNVSSQCPVLNLDEPDVAHEAGKVIASSGAVGKSIDAIVDGALAVKALRSEEVVRKAVRLGLQEANAGRNIPKLASDLPDIGQLAKGTPLALSKAARAGFIGLNALFIGLDVFFICKESVSLAKGEKSEQSQILRSRSSLWRTEIDTWDEIYDCLSKGKDAFTENLDTLDQPLNATGIRLAIRKCMMCFKRIRNGFKYMMKQLELIE
uniref:Apolipoprotein L n=1 Tax=Astyanax mexicanus TaxID=7994 RepID=A0A3B1IP73_ASTMX